MIVKVQLSISSNTKERMVLVYNKSRSFTWQGPVTKDLLEAIAEQKITNPEFNELRSFWHADAVMNPRKKGEKASYFINLIRPAKEQSW